MTNTTFEIGGREFTFEMITCVNSEDVDTGRVLAMLIKDSTNVSGDDNCICYNRDLPEDEEEAFDILYNEVLDFSCETIETVESLVENSLYDLIADKYSLYSTICVHDRRLRPIYAGVAYEALPVCGYLVVDFYVETFSHEGVAIHIRI